MTITWPLKRPPFRAQIEALEKGWDKPGFNFYLEQGLGKSATTLANFVLLRQAGKCRRMIVVVPNSFKGGWVDEIQKEGVDVPTFVWQAGSSGRLEKFLDENHDWIIIINWEAMSRWTELFGERVTKNGHLLMVAADESIKLKNPKALWTKAVLWLGDRAGWTRNLSGKPVTQGSQDLWAQLKFCKFIKKMNYYAFRNRFCTMGGYMGKQVVGAQNTDELNRILNDTSFLARKKDFTDLPAKLEPVTLPVELRGDQLRAYKEMEKHFLAEIYEAMSEDPAAPERHKITVDMILSRDIKLRQIMSGWIYDDDRNVKQLIDFEENHRFQTLNEVISEQVSGKSVVVAWYKPTIQALLDTFTKQGFEPTFIRGGMTTHEIDQQKAAFNTSDHTKVIVVQQVAAKYGHTLLGTRAEPCSTMQFFEQSYSLDDRSQIEDRIHRYGQVWPCSYYDFVAGKLDRACIRALQRKESVAAAVLGYAKGLENVGLQAHALHDALGIFNYVQAD